MASAPSTHQYAASLGDNTSARLNLFGICVRNLHHELLFDSHYHLDRVQRVKPKVVLEVSVGRQLASIDLLEGFHGLEHALSHHFARQERGVSKAPNLLQRTSVVVRSRRVHWEEAQLHKEP